MTNIFKCLTLVVLLFFAASSIATKIPPFISWIGLPPNCNPTPQDCPPGTHYLTNTKYLSYNISTLPAPSQQCKSGYMAVCTTLTYLDLPNWMYNSINNTNGLDKRQLGDTPINQIFLPGSHDTMTYGLQQSGNFSQIRMGSDSSVSVINKIISIIPFSEPTISEVILKWSKAQTLTLYEQLSLGIRYLDMRLALDTNNGAKYPTFSDLKFTHSMIVDITLADAIDQIANFTASHPNEIIIIDFQYILNLCTTNTDLQFYVPSDIQIAIQIEMLNYIQTKLGSKLSNASDSVTNSYNYFIDKASPIIVLFDSDGSGGEGGITNAIVPIANNTRSFPDYWQVNGYPWVRNRERTISPTMANVYSPSGDPSGSWQEAKCQTPVRPCYEQYSDIDKLVVFGATVGLTTTDKAAQIRCGDFCPYACLDHLSCMDSEINYAQSMINQSANFAPIILNNLLDHWGAMYQQSYLPTPINPPPGIKTHNIYLYDNVGDYPVSSIIVAANRGELQIAFSNTNK